MLTVDYEIETGKPRDKNLLIKFMTLTYSELFPEQKEFSHLKNTVENYFSHLTPLWWVKWTKNEEKIACLWLGNAIDQVNGKYYSHIFLVYVKPEHRRQGIGKYLLKQGEKYAREKGHLYLSLQVYPHNKAALNLYNNLGYHEQKFFTLFKDISP